MPRRDGRRAGGQWLLPALAALFALAHAAVAAATPACPEGSRHFPALYGDPALFEDAIAEAASYPAGALTGIAVPHHLLVPHLVALGFQAASGGRPERVVILAPDHFRQARKPFAVTKAAGFDTALGPVPGDPDAAEALLRALPTQVEESCLFAAEHGVQAMLPFVRRHFPGVPVLAVAVAVRSTRADWDAMAEALVPLAGPGTLVVQSTDFSHFLPEAEARRFDQQVLNVLASGSLDGLAGLNQPAHVDSLGSFLIQATLQGRQGAEPAVIANENSQSYGRALVQETTSYMVIGWGPRERSVPLPAGARRVFVAGDTFFGRAMPIVLGDELAAGRIERAVRAVTEGAALVVNLEGVILPEVPPGLPHLTLAMPEDLAIAWLKRLDVRGVGLANNHARDLGEAGLAETRAALRRAGIPAAGPGEVLSFPGLDLVALSDLDTTASPQTGLLTDAALDRLVREGPDRAVVALVHWGREWETAPGPREKELIGAMSRRAVAVVAGAHPHRRSEGIEARAGGDTAVAYSLGNFLFDQTAERGASGALLELTVFKQGTVFPRMRALPNLFDLGRNPPPG